jgi:hypothetical protein
MLCIVRPVLPNSKRRARYLHLQQILETMLQSSEWKAFGEFLSKDERDKLNNAWHRLDGIFLRSFEHFKFKSGVITGWPDATASLYALKSHDIVAALSNGNVRLLVDMAKHAELPWDVVFSSELFMSFKPCAIFDPTMSEKLI